MSEPSPLLAPLRPALYRLLAERSRYGKIVLMSSARGLLGHPAGYTAYCASKSAVDVTASGIADGPGSLGQ